MISLFLQQLFLNLLFFTVFTSEVHAQTTITIPVSVTSRFVTSADGTKIYAEAIGNYSGKNLVLTHGLLLSVGTLDKLFFDPIMQNTFYMIRYDLRGHGQSGKPTDASGYTSDKWAQDFNAIVDSFRLTDVYYLGWSYGGTVPTDIYANAPPSEPNPLKAIISLAGLPFVGPIQGIIGLPLLNTFIPGITTTTDVISAFNTHISFVDSCFANPSGVPYTLKSEWVGFSISQTPDVTAFVITRPQDPTKLFTAGSAGLPLLILGGAQDAQINDTALIQQMAPHFPNLESHIIPGAGHASFFDATSTVVNYITAFVAKVEH